MYFDLIVTFFLDTSTVVCCLILPIMFYSQSLHFDLSVDRMVVIQV